MHPNPAFRQDPREKNLAFARARGFGILSVNGPEGPLAAHIPFLLNDDASFAELHLARSNPIARATLPAPALLAVAGPDAYISPDWYGPHDRRFQIRSRPGTTSPSTCGAPWNPCRKPRCAPMSMRSRPSMRPESSRQAPLDQRQK